MHERLGDKDHYEKPRLSQSAFVIKHYADNVAYEVAGFMEKNKVGCGPWRLRPAKFRCLTRVCTLPRLQDTIFEEHLILLRGSSVELVCQLFQEGKGSTGSKEKDMKKTVGSQFQQSLS